MIKFLQRSTQILLFLSINLSFAQQNFWSPVQGHTIDDKGEYEALNPDKVSFYTLDVNSVWNALDNAPKRGTQQDVSTVQLALPQTDGTIEIFSVYEASVLAPSLSLKYPTIKSYIGYSESRSISRFSLDHKGLKATLLDVQGSTTYIRFLENNNSFYAVYTSDARDVDTLDFHCSTKEELNTSRHSSEHRDANDQLLRTYRLAVSATGEYTQFYGGTVVDALAAINATITQVNMIFETDISATFEIQDFDQLIYLDSTTDPYSDPGIGSDSNNFGTLDWWGVQLQNNLTTTIGNSSYDIGHLFAIDNFINGNAGCIGCVCRADDNTSNVDMHKGAGFTAFDSVQGEYFDKIVAHEIGHQMGANHTFSFFEEGGTITNSEPGSGTTIMSYAGITGDNNVLLQQDNYFHYHSIRQMTETFVTQDCWLGNNPLTLTNNPPVANAGPDFTIPIGTAYQLVGSATDPDVTDNLTYTWEGTNNGTVSFNLFGPTWTEGSMIRSLPPSPDPVRFVPNLARVAANQLTETFPTLGSDWETVATVNRVLDYAFTVRDRSAMALGLSGQTSFDTMQVTVDETAGPFVVISPVQNDTWFVESQQTVTWDVAGTDTGNINTANVNILLSLDGGQTFPILLANDVPNTGSAIITVPSVGGSTINNARIIVEASDNIFFAMNPSNFEIQEIEFELRTNDTLREVCAPDNAIYEFEYQAYLGYTGVTTFSANNLPSGVTASFSPMSTSVDDTLVTVTISGTENFDTDANPFGINFDIVGTSGSIVNTKELSLRVFDNNFDLPTTVFPSDGSTGVDINTSIGWNIDPIATDYFYEVATDINFNDIIDSGLSENVFSQDLDNLLPDTTYYWRVTPENICGTGPNSQTYSFTTSNCGDYGASDLPIDIETAGTLPTYQSVITVNQDFIISDINVLININHTWTGDLDISLTGPNGTTIDLSSDNGGSGNDYFNTVFDQEATQSITSVGAPFFGTFIPEGDLSVFYGISSLGDWTLNVVDDFPSADGGTINTFTLDLCGPDSALSISANEPIDRGVSVFPNPNNGTFTLRSSTSMSLTKVKVYDINGRNVFSNDVNENGGQLNAAIAIPNLEPGVYIVEIDDNTYRTTKRIIVQ